MKEQFISYEIALALKDMWFNEKCFGYYSNVETLILEVRENSSLNKPDMYGKYCSAPLWQQVIDWFREEHNIHIAITVNPYSELTEVNGYKIYMDKNTSLTCIVNQETQAWSNYKAREQAILKAIELCK
jgi:hypothetical protein